MDVERIKIAVVGPKQVGKSSVVNFLGKLKDGFGGEYIPTSALRIVEVERDNLQLLRQVKSATSNTTTSTTTTTKALVELWDVSGDKKFQNCWPAIHKDMHGVIFVTNPPGTHQIQGSTTATDTDLDFWYKNFVLNTKLKQACCLVLSHSKTGSSSRFTLRKLYIITSEMKKIRLTLFFAIAKSMEYIKFGESGIPNSNIREAFDMLLESVISAKHESEENSVLQK